MGQESLSDHINKICSGGFSTQLNRINNLVLSCSDGGLGLLDDDLLGLTLLALELEGLAPLQLDLTRLHQLDLHAAAGHRMASVQSGGKFSTSQHWFALECNDLKHLHKHAVRKKIFSANCYEGQQKVICLHG